MPGFTVERTIDAPVDEVWAELADFGEIQKWNPGVTESYLTSEETEGEGITRHCSLKPFGSLKERVAGWHPGERLVVHIYQINRLPLKDGIADFTLHDEGEGTTRVHIDYTYELKWWAKLMPTSLLHAQLERGFGALLKGLDQHVTTNA